VPPAHVPSAAEIAQRADPLATQLARVVAGRAPAGEQALLQRTPETTAAGGGDGVGAATAKGRTSVSGWQRWGIGTLQLLGGTVELIAGGAAMAAPEPLASKVGGALLIGHGADTLTSGIGTLWSGEISTTYTARAGEAGATALGASKQTAHWVGIGFDVAGGVGPSIGVGVARRLAIAGTTDASTSVTLGYLHRSATEIGHNVVGVTTVEGDKATTLYFHLVRDAGDAASFKAWNTTAEVLTKKGYLLTRVPVSTAAAQRGKTAAVELLRKYSGGKELWSELGPNCTTAANTFLDAAGASTPAYAQTPMLLHLGVNYGWSPVSGAAGALSSTVAGGASSQR
jgi:hypothetical protein